MTTPLSPQMHPVEERLLSAAQLKEIGYILVNEIRQVASFEIACLIPGPDDHDIPFTISSIAEVDRNAPFSQYLRRIYPHALDDSGSKTVRLLTPADLPDPLREEWNQWLPAQVLICPLMPDGETVAAIFLAARTQVWTNTEAIAIHRLCTISTALIRALRRPSWIKQLRLGWKIRPAWMVVAIILLFLCLPVRSAVLGMGEVVALNPLVIRAPVDGIVNEMAVRPFQAVEKGQPLVLFEQLRIDNQLVVARETLRGAEEALRQAKQGALFITDSAFRLPELEVKREDARAELAYLEELKNRMIVVTPMPGLALIDDVHSWAGKSVNMGERLLTIADPDKVEVKVWISAGDAGLVKVGDRVHLYLNVSPEQPIHATVHSVSYQPKESPKGVLAYEVLATIEDAVPDMHIGYFGTGRIFGKKMMLGLYLLRRPLAIARIWLGV